MWIFINGEDKTNEVADYYIDNETRFVNIKYKNGHKYYHFNQKNIKIGPVEIKELCQNELFLYKDQIVKIEHYKKIGDRVVAISCNGKETFYKSCNVHIETFYEYERKEDESVFIKEEPVEVDLIAFSTNYCRVNDKQNDEPFLYKKEDVSIVKNECNDQKSMMEYFKEIAKIKDLKMKDKAENYLMKQMDHMILQKESSLHAFLTADIQTYALQGQTIYPFGINLSQKDAIKNAGRNQLSMIQGPPGTGKTQSILNILANSILHDQKTAVVSSNNEAVKNVKEKMEQAGFGFLIAMIGNTDNNKEFFNAQPDYPEELNEWHQSVEAMDTLLKEIGMHEQSLITLLNTQNELSIIKQSIIEYEHEYRYFEEYLKANESTKLKKLEFFQLNDKKMMQLLIDLNHQSETSLKLLNKIKYFCRYGIYDYQQFNDVDALILDVKDQYYQAKLRELAKRQHKYEKQLEKTDFFNELEQLVTKSNTYFKAFLAKKYAKNLDHRKKFALGTYRSTSEFSAFLDEYPIILSTTHAIAKSLGAGCMLDYLIVDEASQVELVPGIIALSIAKNAVIVGDLKQLPHIPDEQIKEEQYEAWHKQYAVPEAYHYQTHSLLSSFHAVFGQNIANVLLKEHYRCHDRIIGFCNKKYYNHELICHAKVESDLPMVLLKTMDGNHMRYGKNAVNKITNLREIESLLDEKFLTAIQLPKMENQSVGFIAPFRGQADLADHMLPSEFQKNTVHKFQGRECDVVMFSTVLDKKIQSKHRMKFVDDPHLINVAVSRAKERFILVSDVDVFKKANGELNDLIRYIEYYEEDSILYYSDVRSVFDLLYSDYKEVLEKKQNQKWKLSRYDSENLAYELINTILSEQQYQKYKCGNEIKLKELIRNTSLLDEAEKSYVKHNARVDFLIYSKFDNQPVLAIEVDGFAFHENNPQQIARDRLKDHILEKYQIPLLRLKTNSSKEEEKIKSFL